MKKPKKRKIDHFFTTVISTKESNLPMDVYMVSTDFFKRDKRDYKLLIYNKPFKKRMKWIRLKPVWVSIDKYNPKIITPRKVSWNESDMNKLYEFIKNNYEHFDNHIKYDHDDLGIHLRLFHSYDDIREEEEYNKRYLLRKNTGLYEDLFLIDKEFSRVNFPCIDTPVGLMSLSDDPVVLDEYGFPDRVFIENKNAFGKANWWVVRQSIIPFIKKYHKFLLDLWYERITIDEFKNIMYQNRDYYPDDFLGWESSRIGYTKDGADIYVDTDDIIEKPHFHYIKGDIKIAISLIYPVYIDHYNDTYKLSDLEKDNLVEFLNEKWDVLIGEWNRNNESVKLDKNQSLPDYRSYL